MIAKQIPWMCPLLYLSFCLFWCVAFHCEIMNFGRVYFAIRNGHMTTICLDEQIVPVQ